MSRSQYNTQGDTPHSFSRTTKSIFIMEEKIRSVREAVNAELKGHVRLCETDAFLNALLPVPQDKIDLIFEKLKKQLDYSKRWTCFPKQDNKPRESLFYGPFIQAASAILGAVPDKKNGLKGEWLDRHDETPQSSEESAKARPDCFFVARPLFVKELEKEVRELEGRMTLRDATLKQRRAQLEAKQSVWWRQIHIPVEIKKNNEVALFKQGIVQACTYLRLVLREQLDRRFAIALLLCGEELTVLLNDRSGLVYTKTPINIHTNPLVFIQVIAAFFILQPREIGWDPQMMVYEPKSRQSKPSYEIREDDRFFKQNLTETHWEIDIPRSLEGGRETAITLRALSISRSEVMCGRATLVWEVILKRDLDINDSEKKIFVLKRYWHPYQPSQDSLSFMSEADRYLRVPSWANRIHSYEDILISDDQDESKDSTLERIRAGLTMESRPSDSNHEHKRTIDDAGHDHMHVTDWYKKPTFLDSGDESLVSRVHTQIIHSYTGYPLRHFKDLTELLHTIRDVVEEHKDLYYQAGILHRDISVENIIILPQNSDRVGRLIDLDHAKVVDSWRTIEAFNGGSPEVEKLRKMAPIQLPDIKNEVLTEFVKHFAVRRATDIVTYIAEIVEFRQKYFDLDVSCGVNLNDMGWHHQINNPPDFSKHKPREGLQTGTLPFMSVEILKKGTVFKLQQGNTMKDWCHDAIHDIESLFWVMTYICLVREGPGMNMLRKELRNDDSENTDLQKTIHHYFDITDPKDILVNKQELFTDNEKMKDDLLPKFHPYFEPLKGMMIQWWRIMLLAYEHRKFEYYTIHDQIIDIVDKAMKELSESQDPRTVIEEERRREAREGRLARVQGKDKVPEHESPQRIARFPVFAEPMLPGEVESPIHKKPKRR